MSTEKLITVLFCHIDDQMAEVPKHPQASLYPSEVVTLAFLFVLTGKGTRTLYRWLKNNWHSAFPHLPQMSRKVQASD